MSDRQAFRTIFGTGRSSLLRREAWLIVAFIIAAASLFVVIKLASEIQEHETTYFDRWLMLALRQPQDPGQPIGPQWLRAIFVDITALGGVTNLTLLTIVDRRAKGTPLAG